MEEIIELIKTAHKNQAPLAGGDFTVTEISIEPFDTIHCQIKRHNLPKGDIQLDYQLRICAVSLKDLSVWQPKDFINLIIVRNKPYHVIRIGNLNRKRLLGFLRTGKLYREKNYYSESRREPMWWADKNHPFYKSEDKIIAVRPEKIQLTRFTNSPSADRSGS